MKLVFETYNKEEAEFKLTAIKSLGKKGIIKYDKYYKKYKVYQTN